MFAEAYSSRSGRVDRMSGQQTEDAADAKAKKRVLDAVRDFAGDATIEGAMECLYFLAKVH